MRLHTWTLWLGSVLPTTPCHQPGQGPSRESPTWSFPPAAGLSWGWALSRLKCSVVKGLSVTLFLSPLLPRREWGECCLFWGPRERTLLFCGAQTHLGSPSEEPIHCVCSLPGWGALPARLSRHAACRLQVAPGVSALMGDTQPSGDKGLPPKEASGGVPSVSFIGLNDDSQTPAEEHL